MANNEEFYDFDALFIGVIRSIVDCEKASEVKKVANDAVSEFERRGAPKYMVKYVRNSIRGKINDINRRKSARFKK